MFIHVTIPRKDVEKLKQFANEKRLPISTALRLLAFERLTQLDSVNKKYIEE